MEVRNGCEGGNEEGGKGRRGRRCHRVTAGVKERGQVEAVRDGLEGNRES